jgi:hypothetical protein
MQKTSLQKTQRHRKENPNCFSVLSEATKIKILSAISRILFLLQGYCNKGHHLSCCNITVTILLPTLPYVRQSIPQTSRPLPFQEQRYMWHYSIQSLPIPRVTMQDCEPLPHIFTLTLLAYGGYFLWHFFLFLYTSTSSV